jgi:hypothetical protein
MAYGVLSREVHKGVDVIHYIAPTEDAFKQAVGQLIGHIPSDSAVKTLFDDVRSGPIENGTRFGRLLVRWDQYGMSVGFPHEFPDR